MEKIAIGLFHENVTLKNDQNEIVFDRYHLSILLLVAIRAKLIGPHGGIQVDKQKVCQVTGSVDSPLYHIWLGNSKLTCLKKI